MKRYVLKYVVFLYLGIATLIFLVITITDFVTTLIPHTVASRLIIDLVAALFLSLVVAIGISIFNPVFADAMITLRRMLRIESLSNPLLLRLSSEAPGTYHHSLNVSNLAQKAAKAIGADSLIVRTAAYYHDIGKLTEPTLYVENQSGIEVPTSEDAESIRKNANAIIAHAENGVKIAQKASLPQEIIDLIREHHGTTRALYFYVIAKERGLKIKKTDFRYDGPAPNSKESAILMLADCVEATARATSSLTPEKIKVIVETTIEDRLNEKQFRNSQLNEMDFAKIKSSLEETLLSIYHQRIEYKRDDKN